MFNDLNRSIEIAGKHTDEYANTMRILGSLGAGYLPRLARWWGDINTQFSTFLTKAENDGSDPADHH